MKETFTAFVLVILAVLVVLCFLPAYKPVETQYVRRICVDKSEKIEQALSNAVEDVTSRKFTVVSISVKKCIIDDDFIVEAKGIDRGQLLLLGK